MSFVLYVVVALLAFGAFKTKPGDASFRAYLKSRSEGDKKKGNLFSRIFVRGTSSTPRYKLQDLMVAQVASVEEPLPGTYLGVFGAWYPLAQAQLVDEEGAITSGTSSVFSAFSPSPASSVSSAVARGEEMKTRGNVQRAKRELGAAAGSYLAAARAFEEAGTEFERIEAANCYHEAFKCHQQGDNIREAVEALTRSAELFQALGKAARAAKGFESLCQLQEKQDNLDSALQSARVSSDLYSEANQSEFSPMLEKVGDLLAKTGRYEEAHEVLQRLARLSVASPTLRFSTKGYMFDACVALAALGDWVRVKKALKEFVELDPTFEGTREHTLLNELLRALDAGDVAGFAAACKAYDQISPLAGWKLKALKGMKDAIAAKDDDLC